MAKAISEMSICATAQAHKKQVSKYQSHAAIGVLQSDSSATVGNNGEYQFMATGMKYLMPTMLSKTYG